MTHGTTFIDLSTKKPIDVLETCKQEDVTEWLKAHSNITLITRDGFKMYAKAVTEVSPSILQVGDRWHILHHLFEAVKQTNSGVVPVKWQPPSCDTVYKDLKHEKT